MITAKEARKIALKNPSFERKIQMFKDVSERIEKVASEGKTSFSLSEEEHLALEKELVEKGYKRPEGVMVFISEMNFSGKPSYIYNF